MIRLSGSYGDRMPQFEDFSRLIDQLDPVEREQLFVVLYGKIFSQERLPKNDSQPAFPSIVATPGICGGSPRVIRTRIPVWVLERMRQRSIADSDILRSFPALRAVDLVQAWSYADQHRESIAQEIQENEQE